MPQVLSFYLEYGTIHLCKHRMSRVEFLQIETFLREVVIILIVHQDTPRKNERFISCTATLTHGYHFFN